MDTSHAKAISGMRDSAYMAITECLGLADEAMNQNNTEVLLIITQSGEHETALLGGTLTVEAINRAQGLLDQLKKRFSAEEPGDRLIHVYR